MGIFVAPQTDIIKKVVRTDDFHFFIPLSLKSSETTCGRGPEPSVGCFWPYTNPTLNPHSKGIRAIRRLRVVRRQRTLSPSPTDGLFALIILPKIMQFVKQIATVVDTWVVRMSVGPV